LFKFLKIFALILIISSPKLYSCCSQASSGGTGRLLAHERALVELSYKTNLIFGAFKGQKFSLKQKLPYMFEQNLHIMARVVDYFMPFVHIPVTLKKTDNGFGGGLSDISFGARSSVLKENLYWPSVSLIAAVKAPTGRKTTKNWSLGTEDITSFGEWQGSLTFIFEKEFSPVTYGLSYGLLIEKERLGHGLSLSANFLAHETGSISLNLSPIFYGPMTIDGYKIPNSQQRKISLGSSYALKLHSKFSLIISAGLDLPISYLGKNFDNEFFIKLATRLGVF
jgi:hypothetical protein